MTEDRNSNSTAVTIGFESDLWRAADTPRAKMDAAKHKRVFLGLILLRYFSVFC